MVSLILLAMEEELDGVLKLLSNVKETKLKDNTIYEFKIKGKEYIMTLGKIGKVSTALFLGYLSSVYPIERVFNVGTSGALSSKVNIGDIVIADGVMYHDVDVTGFNYELGTIPGCPKVFIPDEEYLKRFNFKADEFDFKIHRGLVISGDTFITKKNVNRIPQELINSALCGEMESGSVGQCCYLLNIPFIVIRSISDYVFENVNNEAHSLNLAQVSENAGKVLLKMIG